MNPIDHHPEKPNRPDRPNRNGPWPGATDASEALHFRKAAPGPVRLAWLILLLIVSTAWAEPTLPPPRQKANLAPSVSVYHDPSGELTLADLVSPEGSARFFPNESDMITVEGKPGHTWLRFQPIAPPDGSRWLLELGSSELDSALLYLPDPSQPTGYRLVEGRRDGRGSTEAINFRNYSFLLPHQPAGPVYVRLGSHGMLASPVFLWTRSAFQAHTNADFITFGLIYGVMLGMILYNLFIYLSLREKDYLVYVLYMIAAAGYMVLLNGHVAMILDAPAGLLQALEFVFLGLFIIFLITFCQRFCETRINLPRFHVLITGFKWAAGLIIGLAVAGRFDSASLVANVCGILGPINLILIGAIRWKQGYGPAKYFTAANIAQAAGITIYVLWTLGLFPLHTPANIYMTLGPAVESVLFSFALANRIKLLRREKAALVYTSARYKRASEIDPLTGLYNRGYLISRLNDEAEAADRTGRPLSLLILDVDEFKSFNDAHGHPQGDLVLKTLAEVISTAIRDRDVGCRYGGEEFTVILPNSTTEQAAAAAERIRRSIAGVAFRPHGRESVSVTVSLGLAQFRPGQETASDLIQRADQALYRAKGRGKNRLEAAD